MEVVARIYTDFPDKFGIPRQSGLVSSLEGRIVFEPKFRNKDAVRGIEEYSHLWLIWGFSKNKRDNYALTVTPPRLGGKERKGVFATRSPFRPNGLGLSSVELVEVCMDEELGPVLCVRGADLMDQTPIYDIKPYLAYTDAHPHARGSFGQQHKDDRIPVVFPEELMCRLPEGMRKTVVDVLGQDPRAAYNKKPDYVYGMAFADYDIRFKITENTLCVCDVVDRRRDEWTKIK